MPFQSEKQRRYLWANEPEIARDWADTYGSRIEKNSGGITNTVTVPKHWQSAPDHPKTELAYITKPEKNLLVKKDLHNSLKDGPNVGPGGVMSLNGTVGGAYVGGGDMSTAETGGKGPTGMSSSDQAGIRAGAIAAGARGRASDTSDIQKEAKTIKKASRQRTKAAKESLASKFRKKSLQNLIDKKYKLKNKWTIGNIFNPAMVEEAYFTTNPDEYFEGTEFGIPGEDLTDIDRMKQALTDTKLGKTLTQEDWSKAFYGDKTPPNLSGGGGGGHGGAGYMGYPSYEAWLAAQGGGGGGGATAATTTTPSAFQTSLTGTADTPDYYVGNNPLASNITWGKQMGVDPRTMGLTSWAADGGRIPAAYGGIMDSSTGRRAYGLGSIFKSIGRAAKKVFKSPIGKAALIGGAGWMLGGGGNPFTAAGRGGFSMDALRNRFGIKQLLTKDGAGDAFDPWKLGILGASALPFFMGGKDEDEDEGFDYMGAKNAYADEIMRIKAGAMAGTLDPNKFSYLGVKDGGRIGLYAGGQSTPSDYTMEDAMMTTTQDKLGGITDVMKQADLYRQGSVGQFYAAHGGSANDKLMERVKELEDEGLSWDAAWAQAHNELRDKNAQGGRIGAEEGGLMDLGGMEKDYRNDGGFVPLGGEEKADDVPARLSKNEFVFTADAVRGAGGGDIDKGAEIMENIMNNLEQGGQISEETQGLSGAQEMFGVSERLSEVV